MTLRALKKQASTNLPVKLLTWYDANGRELPWRKKGGIKPDPYHVWLSEIMLQQTTVTAVIPYFHKFVRAWPTVRKLAEAPEEQVMTAWAGLGYYARARNLHKCAKAVAALPGAKFPETESDLQLLPGIGPYTSAAIASIAFNRHAAVVDGNIERVITRLRAVHTPLPAAKPRIKSVMAELTPLDRPGDFAQGMMDLGATVCTPRDPDCRLCPWSHDCLARAQNLTTVLPVKVTKTARPTRRGSAFVVFSADNQVLLRRRPPKGLLGGMYEVPGSNWGPEHSGLESAPVKAGFAEVPGTVVHVFTHFELQLRVYRADHVIAATDDCIWVPLSKLDTYALPTVMIKVLKHAMAADQPGPLFGNLKMRKQK